MKQDKGKKISLYWKIVIVYTVVLLVLNLSAMSQKISDIYVEKIFGDVSGVYCRLTGLFSFSIGEILVGLCVIAIILALAAIIAMPVGKRLKKNMLLCRSYLKGFLIFIYTVILVMTLNCTIPYNCSKMQLTEAENTYDAEELIKLRNYVVQKCNELSLTVSRDEKGEIVYQDNVDENIKAALRALSDEFPRLGGYYPDAKPMLGSYFMYQAGMAGVYFPFSMEANYNSYIRENARASVIAHELSHLKGYMYEDEANFIAYLACTGSEDDAIKYSGYLSVLQYLEDDVFFNTDYEEYELIMLSELVYDDYGTYTNEVETELEEMEGVVSDETMSSVSDTFTESYLQYYGAEANYDEVTMLMLDYYTQNKME